MLDNVDRSIIAYVQKNPAATHTEIAENVNRSQPTVGTRLKKLEESGFLKYQAGIDTKTVDLYYGFIKIQSNNPELVKREIEKCPYLIHGYKLNGLNNIIVIAAAREINFLEKIVNNHFRRKDFIKKVSMNIIYDIYNEFIIPVEVQLDGCYCIK